jgi:hypothetical protein
VRQHPEIAVDLVRGTAGIPLPEQAAVSLAPTDMSAVVPVQYLADIVVLISDVGTGKPVLAVIIEPQLRDSETKRFSWPVYVTTARQLIRTGHPGFDLAPIVIDAANPPGRDGGGPFLTVFAASMGGIDMATEHGARMVLDAMASIEVSDADRLRVAAIIMSLASDAARQTLEAIMQTSDYEKTFVERIYDQGEAEGEVKGETKALLKLLDKRGLTLTDEQREKIGDCTETAQLDLWFDRAITASSTAEVFAE